jgi:hypothetical protein
MNFRLKLAPDLIDRVYGWAADNHSFITLRVSMAYKKYTVSPEAIRIIVVGLKNDEEQISHFKLKFSDYILNDELNYIGNR